MPVFEHVSTYPQPRAEVFAWHDRGGGFTRLTPPGAATIVEGPTRGIAVGSELVLRVSTPVLAGLLPDLPLPGAGVGPVGVPWRVRHVEYVQDERFVDEQVTGPFRSWRHEHLFADAPGGGTTITDRVTWELPVRLPARLDVSLVDRFLTALFAFRERQLRDDLALHARLGAAPAHVVVTGASGLIGSQVCALLTTGGHTVTRLVRGSRPGPGEAAWDPVKGSIDEDALRAADAVVHLAGAPIGGRFTPRHKDAILRSRVDGTATLARALASEGMPRTLVQASGIGVYGARRPGELLTEESEPGTGFLADVVRAWEGAAAPAEAAGVRAVFLRTGIVLSAGGGALLPQLPLFLVGLGGRLTSPGAWLSWITLDDMARAYVHALFTPALAGPVNAVAPQPVTSRDFARQLGRALHRPALLPTPPFGPALILGREGASELIDTDQRVSAARLQASGFEFAHPDLPDALRHVLAG
nr:TIGR01777 family protein [Propionibacterium sp.]